MWKPEEDMALQQAINGYLVKNGLSLIGDVTYDPCIDGVDVCVSGNPVLMIGLPPVSNYSIHETEYTNKFLRTRKVAVV